LSEPGRGRIARRWATLRAAGRPALIPYVTAGFPSAEATVATLHALADEGADFVEVGIPFSDPLADGPVIQRASFAALQGGTTVRGVLDMVRAADLPIPVVLFSYVNPVLRYGLARFLDDARQAGASGVLLTDLPVGEDPALETVIEASGLDRIPLVALTTTRARLATSLEGASGFVYLISRLGVTGGGTTIGAEVATAVAAVRAVTALPVVLGFGIGTGAEAAAAAEHADGVVVGSALVSRMADGPAAVRGLVAELRRAMDAVAVAP
jgi:tryptophan synthase alpha chain